MRTPGSSAPGGFASTAVSPIADNPLTGWGILAWRIPGAMPPFWEVANSRYLAEFTPLGSVYGTPALHHYVLLTLAGSAYELLEAHVYSGPLVQAATVVAKRLYQKRTAFSVPDSLEPVRLGQPQDIS